MNRITRRGALAVLVFALAALTLAPVAHAQPRRFREEPPPDITTIPGGGTELFRAFLAREGIQPIAANELRDHWPLSDDIIVIVVGDARRHEWFDPLKTAQNAIQVNGAALIASDSSIDLVDTAQGNNVGRFTGNLVRANQRDCYKGFDDCPLVVPLSPNEFLLKGETPGRVWDVFRGLDKLATNQPTHIVMYGFRGEYQYPLATLPKTSFTIAAARFKPGPVFAVGGDGPPQGDNRPGYSFLAVADSSVFINQMIMETDTDNYEFTRRTIEYLQGPNKYRKRCIFIENGRVLDKFDGLQQAFQKPRPKIPPDAFPNLGSMLGKNQDKLVDIINKAADKAQSNDWLHKMMMGSEGSHREQLAFGKWVQGTAILLAVAISFFLLRRTLRARHSTDVPPAPSTGAGAAATGPPGVFERRQKELVRRNNLYEPVQNLMREFFISIGAPPNAGPRIPRLIIPHQQVRKPDSLRRAIRDMWRIAYGPPMYLSAQRWFELEPYFERIRQAHTDGKWRFASDEEA